MESDRFAQQANDIQKIAGANKATSGLWDAGRLGNSELVGRLYTLRCVADYHPSIDVDGRDAREAISIMNTVFESF